MQDTAVKLTTIKPTLLSTATANNDALQMSTMKLCILLFFSVNNSIYTHAYNYSPDSLSHHGFVTGCHDSSVVGIQLPI